MPILFNSKDGRERFALCKYPMIKSTMPSPVKSSHNLPDRLVTQSENSAHVISQLNTETVNPELVFAFS